LFSVHRIRYFCVPFDGVGAGGVSGVLPHHLGHMWGYIPDRYANDVTVLQYNACYSVSFIVALNSAALMECPG
jgi:hypothetical protein